jgi:hypothetical protein
MAQGVGPEFKSQYHKKNYKKKDKYKILNSVGTIWVKSRFLP